MPDKAIDLIDEASSKIRLKAFTAPPEIKQIEEKLHEIAAKKHESIQNQEFEKSASLRDEEEKVRKELDEKKKEWEKKNSKEDLCVTEDDICDIISDWTGIPVKKLAAEEQEKLKNMEEILHKRVVGQDEAVNAVARAIRRGRVGLKDPKRPTGSFIFLGPTGVGKTELCKALAESIFGDENAIIRIDMSEYMAEKAHPDVFNILLQILDDGILTDSQGRKVDFKNTVVIMTSNIGARLITEKSKSSLGFGTKEGSSEDDYNSIKEKVLGELKNVFRPELLNRIDEIIVFHKLTEENIEKITGIMTNSLKKRVEALGYELEITDEAIKHLAKNGYDDLYGARPLRRAIQSEVEDLLADEMLSGKFEAGAKITVDCKDDKIILK